MYVKPNMHTTSNTLNVKNDLFRKFKPYFIGATEKEFRQFDLYGKEGYVSVNPAIEERIIDTLGHEIDEILPITGATGIGKTYLLLYCLKSYYDVDNILANSPQIFKKDNAYDLVYYSDFNITEQTILKNPHRLMLAKIQAMYEYIRKYPEFKIVDEPDVEDYIQEKKLEVKYYANDDFCYQKALYELIALINSVPINNIIFVFDDLESLNEDEQFSLMESFLTLFENFKTKSEGRYRAKFIFCLRNSTYYNIYKQDFYNTHRASKASHLAIAPPLSQIFKKRFDIILKSDKVAKAKNLDTWKEAKDILISLAERVDTSYTNLLLKLNNNNISSALDDFLSIISNRRWTQKNANPAATFKIEAGDYYINDTNILRILSMGEQNVYLQSPNVPVRCILPDPGVSPQADLIAMLVLRAFRFRTHSIIEDAPTKLLSVNDVVDQVIKCILPANSEQIDTQTTRVKDNIQKAIVAAFEYYAENRFIRKNTDPRAADDGSKYFILPRGEQIFDLFFSQSILFTIFRDAYLWDAQIYDTQCSFNISFENLLIEALKYQYQLMQIESEFFTKIVQTGMLRSYVAFWGTWSIAESFLTGIERSVMQYYKDLSAAPEKIRTQLENAKETVRQHVRTFEQSVDEEKWF